MKKLTQLLEYVEQSSTGLRVDREKGIIFDVKLLGRTSKNTHGNPDVTGTDYEPDAVRAAVPFYEGLKGYVNHPPRKSPNAERDAHDSLCVYTGVYERGGEIFAGQMNLLKSHPMATRLMDAAENPLLNKLFACSHNAYGRTVIREGRLKVVEIPKDTLRSVDVVADGGSCTSLREGRETPMLKKWKETIAAANLDARAKLKPLLEMGEYADMEMEEPETAAPADQGWQHHLGEMVKAILNDGEMDDEAKCKKIIGIVEEMMKAEEPVEEEEEEETPTADASEGEEKKKTEESLKRAQKENKALRFLMEAGVVLDPKDVRVKALTNLDTDAEMQAMAATYKTTKAPGKTPKSQAPGSFQHTAEGKEIDLMKLAQTSPEKVMSLLTR